MPPPPPRSSSFKASASFQPERPEKDNSPVKTPRPDITIGLSTTALVDELKPHFPTETHAKAFLDSLQWTMKYQMDRGQEEPVLCSEPTQRSANLHFPFLVVESNSATGKTLFEAQNQAAVAGACALKILLDLGRLARSRGSHGEGLSPVVFSICTSGPNMLLSMHYTTEKNGLRFFHMWPIKSCYPPIEDELLPFLTMVHNIIRWGTGDLLKDTGEKLRVVASRATGGD